MSGARTNSSPAQRALLKPLALGAMLASAAVMAAEHDSVEPLDESAYRLDMEEVVVTGQAPQWRQLDQPEWRSERFKLKDASELPQPRMEWFPEYTRDERDNFEGVRDRMDEEAGIKIFEWRF